MDEFRGTGVKEAIAAATHDHRQALLGEAKARGHVERDKERRLAKCRPVIAQLRRTQSELSQIEAQTRTIARRLPRLRKVVRNLQRQNPGISSATGSLVSDILSAAGILAAFRAAATTSLALAAGKLSAAIGTIGLILGGSRLLVDAGRSDLAGLQQQLAQASQEIQTLRGKQSILLSRYRSGFSRLERECSNVPGYPWGFRPI